VLTDGVRVTSLLPATIEKLWRLTDSRAPGSVVTDQVDGSLVTVEVLGIAAAKSSRPAPWSFTPRPMNGRAVLFRSALIPAGLESGEAWRARATAPATCGVAIEVPDSRLVLAPPQLEAVIQAAQIATPGAARSGLPMF
jgi:hypothetical protein